MSMSLGRKAYLQTIRGASTSWLVNWPYALDASTHKPGLDRRMSLDAWVREKGERKDAMCSCHG